MAFPPNYRQERSNRERSKQRKAQEKQAKRDEKTSQRQDGVAGDLADQPQDNEQKDI